MAKLFQLDVFLNYSANNKAVVRVIAERLRKVGLSVWFDEWEIKPGDNIAPKIEEALEHSRVLACRAEAPLRKAAWPRKPQRETTPRARNLERRPKTGPFWFRDPPHSAFAQRLRRDKQERRFIPLRLGVAGRAQHEPR